MGQRDDGTEAAHPFTVLERIATALEKLVELVTARAEGTAVVKTDDPENS